MGLTATLSEIVLGSFDTDTGAYRHVALNNVHHHDIYNKWMAKLGRVATNKYHAHFLTGIQTQVLDTSL
jgi:hypothetical protein